ncbi:MAG: hypothetical protein M1833_005301 [Piccolia ochrophora]|nr:MAG: hypothetical protein M1833_005301 [Piccolia ochrophora]
MSAPQRLGPRPYKDFLTTALHRRFTRAAATAFVLCYIEAVFIGEKDSWLWSWFPLGQAGIRTLLLFIPALSIFILRVAQSHIGPRVAPSTFNAFLRDSLRFNTFQTLTWYFFSAWIFSEVYVWSASKDDNLNWIIAGKPYDRPRLNERPIYIRSNFYILAFLQTGVHLFFDYDCVILPVATSIEKASPDSKSALNPLNQLKRLLLNRLHFTLLRSLSMVVVGPLLYWLFVRRTAWSWTHWVAKVFWSLPKSSAKPPTIPPLRLPLLVKATWSSLMLVALWEVSDACFTAFVAQEPLKLGHSLTAESRDPNGSLLTGLQSKKQIPKCFAFWELLYISYNEPTRRKSFFEDIDRRNAPTWTQISSSCIDVVLNVNTRLNAILNPPPATPPQPIPPPQQPPPQNLPRISTPIKEANILNAPRPPSTRREKAEQTIASVAKSHGQSPQPPGGRSPVSPRVRKLLEYSVDKTLTPSQKQALSKDSLTSTFYTYLLRFLRSPAGVPFRQTLHRRATCVVLGTPHADIGTITAAVQSLTQLAVCSLQEDPYGKVQTDVPTIIRVFTMTISNLDAFRNSVQPHWTDVEMLDGGDRESALRDVDALRSLFRTALRRLVDAFGDYADVMGLGAKDMRIAKEAVGFGEEMREKGGGG